MSEYIQKQHKYSKEEKQEYWNIGIGLQDVDHLKPSKYLYELIDENVKGKISLEDVQKALREYHASRTPEGARTKEADLVAARITGYLQTAEFTLRPTTLKNIHKYIFQDVSEVTTGVYKTTNWEKPEPILNGKSVRYEDWRNVDDALKYDIEEESRRSYDISDREAILEGLSSFVSGIWQVHPFDEGNTRTTAVFTILYLQSLGVSTNNKPFESNARYFRDALVRSNFIDASGVKRDFTFLQRFFDNLIYDANHRLDSEDLIVPQLF